MDEIRALERNLQRRSSGIACAFLVDATGSMKPYLYAMKRSTIEIYHAIAKKWSEEALQVVSMV